MFENEEVDERVTDHRTLSHIGIARRSGRYPWGSGQDPYQRSVGFQSYMKEMTDAGLKPTQIAALLTDYVQAHGGGKYDVVRTTDLRAGASAATEHVLRHNIARARQLKDDRGMSNGDIAVAMGMPRSKESTVRGWLKQGDDIKEGSLRATANALKDHVESKPFLDVGKGTELYMGVANTKLDAAIAMLKDEGYNVHHVSVPQLGTDKMTRLRVLTKGDNDWRAAYDALQQGNIQNVTTETTDGGLTWRTPKAEPVSLNSKRLQVRYADEGGLEMDGVIELRRGVDDLSLGDTRYAQVRVAVDGTHYLKGMAMYADDLPDGVDVRFNTNKTKAEVTGKLGALKDMNMTPEGTIDASNPFGATTKPKMFTNKKGEEVTSPLALVNEEGSWDAWSRSLSSQMLSKQPVALARQQLAITQKTRKDELDEINRLTNPVVKRKLLEEYADTTDAAAVHLKAAAMDRQSSHVILPINSMRPTEIYAPNFEQGERVSLVRYPHGGAFEIPELVVNNNNAKAKRILGGAKDAVGIHHTVAERLSGADFDGDTVLVIPNPAGRVKSQKPLKDLENFDPKSQYHKVDGMTKMTKDATQKEMGKVSNLITDMTILGAPPHEIARAVRHSMVVIDAEKHKLNYKQSELDHNIAQLKRDYQGAANAGASTIISRASSTAFVNQRKVVSGDKGVDPTTGEKVYVETGRTKPGKTKTYEDGRVVVGPEEPALTKGTKMEFAKDARDLMSDSAQPMERVYADHANVMKGLANKARLDAIAVVPPRQSKVAKAMYPDEVASLMAKLKVAQRNAPLERNAQIVGGALARARIQANPQYDKDDIKKVRYASLDEARVRVGAEKLKIGSTHSPITPREWEAVQSNAISASVLRQILANSDMNVIRELATPRSRTTLTVGQQARLKALLASGRGASEIAQSLGIPVSTVSDNIKALSS